MPVPPMPVKWTDLISDENIKLVTESQSHREFSKQNSVPLRLCGKLPLQLPLQNFADEIWIRFTFGKFHHLTLEKIQRGGFAGFEIIRRAGIRGDDFIAKFFN